jgi:hypothetical protein
VIGRFWEEGFRLIWTIGYQRLAPEKLRFIAEALDATVVDTRHVPKTRVKGYGPLQLRTLLGDRYVLAGNMLGGRGHVTQGGIDWLKGQQQEGRNVILMCVCHEPGICHRHQDICAPNFPDAQHIYEEEVIEAGELSRSIREDDGYVYYDLVESLTESLVDDAMSLSNSSPD